jgi:hydroxyacid-oxoacid transhydrogenase
VSGPCQHFYRASLGGESAFSIDPASVVFGRGALRELGEHARAYGLRRVGVITDATVGALPFFEGAVRSLREAGIEAEVFDRVRIEPSDVSLAEAAAFARGGRFDGLVSIGGGSAIDTAKIASLLATYPAELAAYVNAPVGEGRPVPGPLPPHIACPTTSGTGAECTGIAICDLTARKAKTGIVSRRLRPTLAIVDPDVTRSLLPAVVAASGLDVLCHAIESYTARPFTARGAPSPVTSRPMSQGANPWSDLGSLEALRLCSKYLVRACRDASDDEAREGMLWAATLAGIAFGNSGVHVPHGMAYAVAGLVKTYRAEGYPEDHALVPHGLSVALSAPAVVRMLGSVLPERHAEVASALGMTTTAAEAGDALAEKLRALMAECALPISLSGVGYGQGDVETLVQVTMMQRRLLENAPRAIDRDDLFQLFTGSL